MNEMAAKNYENKECMYCSGKGYFQLLLGGSETCSCCGGTGKKKD
jgi:DnaJ-class molecular chaperone